MGNYRRMYIPDGTYFFTLVTYRSHGWATSFRYPTFNGQNQNIERFLQEPFALLGKP